MYEISPSTLKNATEDKFACARCFWLKVKHKITPPQMEGLGAFLRRTHDHFFRYMNENRSFDRWFGGDLIETELEVKAKPIHDITLWGYVDGLVKLKDDTYMVVDLKTTHNLTWIVKNYALQLNVYRHCLENPAEGYDRYNITRLGIVSFTDERFGVNTLGQAGIVGSLKWHEVDINDAIVSNAVQRATQILAQESLPQRNLNCEACQSFTDYLLMHHKQTNVTTYSDLSLVNLWWNKREEVGTRLSEKDFLAFVHSEEIPMTPKGVRAFLSHVRDQIFTIEDHRIFIKETPNGIWLRSEPIETR